MRIKMAGKIKIKRIAKDFPIVQLDNPAWETAQEISIEKYWSGKKAPAGRHAKARLLWSENALYVRFEANQDEPLNVAFPPNVATKTIGLWDRDVCEIFVAPEQGEPNKYYEFEVSPLGEWVDLKIHQSSDRRETDTNYYSGMLTAARIERGRITMALAVGWRAFGKFPEAGDIWLGNLFRCVGTGETRGYLAWHPTRTPQPDFHVPQVFGEFEFVK